MKRALLILSALLVAGCGSCQRAVSNVTGNPVTYHDDDRRVTCWLYHEGISCLPDRDVRGAP